MPKLSEICRVRSKNAGPFWITLDIRFPDRMTYNRYSHSAALRPAAIAPLLGTDAEQIKCFSVSNLCVLKISYPRASVQGGMTERDMHGGQQYVRVLDIEL